MQIKEDTSITQKEFSEISAWADDLLTRELVKSAYVKKVILPSIPLLEENMYDKLSNLAHSVRLEDKSAEYYLEFLDSSRRTDLDYKSDPRYQFIIDNKVSTADRVALLRGKYLLSVNKKESAQPYLIEAMGSKNRDVSLRARFALSKIRSWSRGRNKEGIYLDTYRYSSDADLSQDALLAIALSSTINSEKYKRYLKLLIEEYPKHKKTDNAYYWLARGEQITGNLDASLIWYDKLLHVKQQNNYQWDAALYPVMGLIARDQPGDQEKARQILQKFVSLYPNSRYTANAYFWIGRIEEKNDNAEAANIAFKQAHAIQPFGYYGIRSQMHLHDFAAAKSSILIENPALRKQLKQSYLTRHNSENTIQAGTNPYFHRFNSSIKNHFYTAAFEAESLLRSLAPSKRLQDLSFEELDQLGLLARVAVLISLRSDAIAAASLSTSPQARIIIADKLNTVGDFPTSMTLVHQLPVQKKSQTAEIMNQAGYLSVAYPIVYKKQLLSEAAKYSVPPGMLYSVMRNESFYYPFALSHVGALGLFQFMPSTFKDLDKGMRWRLTKNGTDEERQRFLLDPDKSIELGARWFGKRKLPKLENNLFYSFISHHSGSGRIKKWMKHWKSENMNDDLELMIETFRMPGLGPEKIDSYGRESRTFARSTIRDLIIFDAIDSYSTKRKEL